MEVIEKKKKTPRKKKLIKGHESQTLTEKERQKVIKRSEKIFGKYLTSLGFDWRNDPNMEATPHRVTKSHVEELFAGNFLPAPKITSFADESDRDLKYDGVVIQKDISIFSNCSHHFLPFTGFGHIAYMPGEDGKIIGLSKLNRIADYIARRPQVQERLTMQIHNEISKAIPGNKGVAVFIEAKHSCCSNRGIGHDSTMKTVFVSGVFREVPSLKEEFLRLVTTDNSKV